MYNRLTNIDEKKKFEYSKDSKIIKSNRHEMLRTPLQLKRRNYENQYKINNLLILLGFKIFMIHHLYSNLQFI